METSEIPSRERINRNTKDRELMGILKNNYESKNRTKVWGNELSLCLFPFLFTEMCCLNQSYKNSYNCDPGMYVNVLENLIMFTNTALHFLHYY